MTVGTIEYKIKTKESYKTRDLTGLRFGRLIVVSFVERDKRGEPLWKCICDCGIIKEKVRHHGLVNGATTSCGCYHKEKVKDVSHLTWYDEQRRNRDRKLILARPLYNRYKTQAKRRGREFNLTFDEFIKYVFDNCNYCGTEPIAELKVHQYTGSILYNGIDRVDNSKGYIEGNVVTCCEICNRAKLMMTREEFLSWIDRVYKHQHDK